MKSILSFFCLFLATTTLVAQGNKVSVSSDETGMRLIVDGQELMINGMNWGYVPRGTTVATTAYQFWNESDAIIKEALDAEMALLKNMGVNAIRQYTGIPPKWVQYIYENYGIYTMINHSFGRYGLTIDGAWQPNTDYTDPRVRKLLLKETKALAQQFKNTPGILMFLLGNENNYGLFWDGAETEDIPEENSRIKPRARAMYKLFNEAAVAIKEIVNDTPVAICNGDLLFLNIIAQECQDIDIYGTNMYRGVSFGDAFERVKKEYGKPFMFTEFGADAFNAIQNQEDQESQAYYMVGNWKEIYANAAGLGKAGNSIGGFTFQFSDGWWKFGQTTNLDIHDNNASWSNGGYQRDFQEGENNMNEEWFGVCAKGPTNEKGLYTLYPRAAYYALKKVHELNPLALGTTAQSIDDHFKDITLVDAVLKARGDKAVATGGGGGSKISVSSLRAEFTTFNTGGNRITTPEGADPTANVFPDQLGFDTLESYYIGIEANPTPGLRANVITNILGNVAGNPIDEIFFENRGRPVAVDSQNGEVVLIDNNRVQIYQADFDWNTKYADIKGFYRTGHYHWGYEGDFFGLYPEANYGPNIDLYNGLAPFGFEFAGKKEFSGLKVAFGPELWWGANPAVLVKYEKQVGKFKLAGIFHEDLAEPGVGVSSVAIPQPRTRRATAYAQRAFGKLDVELGGIWGGNPLNGREYQVIRTDADGNQNVLINTVNSRDNWGGKIKLKYAGGKFNWYGQAAAQGLVAFGGADLTQTFTGWRLKDSGSGNQYNFLTGFTYNLGNLQIAPNFLWQEPLEDPIPLNAPAPARARNIITDPFVVRSNRRQTAGEILLTYDPTPGSWFYQWDNDRAEDAKFAANLGFVYRSLPTTQDAAIGFFGDSRIPVAFAAAPSAQDLWEVHGRLISKPTRDFGFIANFYAGNGQANGDDDRVITRYGTDVRVVYNKIKLISEVKVDDWGPFDFHRDFNLTFPLQFKLDLSTTLGKQDWFILPNTKLGIRYTWRSLDNFSPRFQFQDPIDQGFPDGNEWEIRTYLHINIGK